MKVSATAPAKINLGLEVLGRRPDGYHEVRTILQTIDVRDVLRFESASELTLAVDSTTPLGPDEDNLILRAARRLQAATGEARGAAVHVTKRIPIAAGLGGGSSDAAATLVGLNRLWNLGLSADALAGLAADLGSDVPYFLVGGTRLASGRGDVLEPLPPVRLWVVLALARTTIEDKTRRLYRALEPGDWTSGAAVGSLVAVLQRGDDLPAAPFRSAFQRASRTLFPDLTIAIERLASAGATPSLCGAGPTIFSVHRTEYEARRVAASAQANGLNALVARAIDEPVRIVTEDR